MKLTKSLVQISVALSTCLLAIPTQAQIVKRGGNSGGGGNLAVVVPMSEYELETFIQESVPKLVLWYFNFVNTPYLIPQEGNGTWLIFPEKPSPSETILTEANSRGAYEKLFLGSEKIFDKMKITKIKIQHEHCFDPVLKVFKDASADAEKNEVCFDTSALHKKIPSSSLRSDVLSLAAHEYSHLMGTSEGEAKLIERAAQYALKVDGMILYEVIDQWESIQAEYELPGQVRTLAERMNEVGDVPLALKLANLSSDVLPELRRSFDLIFLSGLSAWTPEQRQIALLAGVKMQNATSFARSLSEMKKVKDSYWVPEEMAEPWKNGKVTPDLDIATQFLSANRIKLALPIQAKVRYVANGDRAALKLELEEIADLLKELYPETNKENAEKRDQRLLRSDK